MHAAGNRPESREEKQLRAKLRAFQWLCVFLTITIAAILLRGFFINEKPETLALIDPQAPQAKAISQLMRPLQYSAEYALLRPEVSIEVDIGKRQWILKNIRLFDASEEIKLDQDRFGLCAELSAYLFPKIRELLDDRYSMNFIRATHSGFFLGPRGQHIFIRILDTGVQPPQEYYLDPSFSRYGPNEWFLDYLPEEQINSLEGVTEEKQRDMRRNIDTAFPILINGSTILSLLVHGTEGKLDPQNYTLLLLATQRNHYLGKPILSLRKHNGRTETFENAKLAENVLDSSTYERLKTRITYLFNAAKFKSTALPSPPPAEVGKGSESNP